MMFFQAVLLAGYGYAHISGTRAGRTRQIAVHLAILAAACIVLPIAVPRQWAPSPEGSPIGELLLLLLISVGPPFFVLSATAPLLQRWFARTGHPSAGDPYFLYSASNLGSMLALIGYPTWVEPHFRLAEQSRAWTVGYVVILLLTILCAGALWRYRSVCPPEGRPDGEGAAGACAAVSPLTRGERGRWVLFAFVPSSLMLGVTSFLSTDVAAIPLFWVIPLALYLLVLHHRLCPGSGPGPPNRGPASAPVDDRAVPCGFRGYRHAEMDGFLRSPREFLPRLHGLPRGDRPDTAGSGASDGILSLAFRRRRARRHLQFPHRAGCLYRPFRVPPGPDPRRPAPAGRHAGEARPVCEPGGGSSCIIGVPLALVPLTHFSTRDSSLAGALYTSLPHLHVMWSTFSAIVSYGVPALVCYGLVFLRKPFLFGIGFAALFMTVAVSKDLNRDIVHRERSFFGVLTVTRAADGTFMNLSHGTTLHGKQWLNPRQSVRTRLLLPSGGPGRVRYLPSSRGRRKKPASPSPASAPAASPPTREPARRSISTRSTRR